MIAVRKPLADLTPPEEQRIVRRGRMGDRSVAATTARIIADVRDRGDDALRDLARRYDGVELVALEVPAAKIRRARAALAPDLLAALEQAAAAIARFHDAQRPAAMELEVRPGLRLGRRPDPLSRVGVYAPGGLAAYPSSVLMGVVPARVAGVEEVVVCSPPDPHGLPPAPVLAACAIAGADRVFPLGGAGAIAALAFGTESVPAVDKVVGPGNAYVTEAKRQLTDAVAVDTPAGPSELLVLADDGADPSLIALELLGQAEHDPDAAVVLVTTSSALAEAAADAMARELDRMPRRSIAAAALASRGAILTAGTLDAAIRFAERYAPEHLLLMVRRPREVLPRIRAAGTVFLGDASCVAFGDYLTGANHVLPTGGLARAHSGLSTADFVRWTTWQEVDAAAAAELALPTAVLAAAEGLPGHVAAALARAGGQAGSAASPDARTAPVRFRTAYGAVPSYDPHRGGVAVDLSDNTNLFGAPPAALEALASAAGSNTVGRYPTPYGDALKAAVAASLGMGVDHVATGCGSDDLLDSAIRAFCDPGELVATPAPTFPMAEVFALMNAARVEAVPLRPGYELDADRLLATRARILYVCRPNNPTGTLFDRGAVLRLLREAAGLVLLDEAYTEFAGDSLVRDAIDSGHALVLRTLSKAYGLAGLRVGYAVGPPELVRELEKSRGPYKVGGVAERAAVAALTRGRTWVDASVREVRANRDRLAARLGELGLEPVPSAANFLLVPVPYEARRLASTLRDRGIGVRAFPDLPVAGDAIRVTVGPWPVMERLVEELRAILETEPRRLEVAR